MFGKTLIDWGKCGNNNGQLNNLCISVCVNHTDVSVCEHETIDSRETNWHFIRNLVPYTIIAFILM